MACTTFLENSDFVFSLVGANVLLTWLLFATSLWSGRKWVKGEKEVTYRKWVAAPQSSTHIPEVALIVLGWAVFLTPPPFPC